MNELELTAISEAVYLVKIVFGFVLLLGIILRVVEGKGYWNWLWNKAMKALRLVPLLGFAIFKGIPRLGRGIYNGFIEAAKDDEVLEHFTAFMGALCAMGIMFLIMTWGAYWVDHPAKELHLAFIGITFLLSSYGWYRSVTIK